MKQKENFQVVTLISVFCANLVSYMVKKNVEKIVLIINFNVDRGRGLNLTQEVFGRMSGFKLYLINIHEVKFTQILNWPAETDESRKMPQCSKTGVYYETN